MAPDTRLAGEGCGPQSHDRLQICLRRAQNQMSPRRLRPLRVLHAATYAIGAASLLFREAPAGMVATALLLGATQIGLLARAPTRIQVSELSALVSLALLLVQSLVPNCGDWVLIFAEVLGTASCLGLAAPWPWKREARFAEARVPFGVRRLELALLSAAAVASVVLMWLDGRCALGRVLLLFFVIAESTSRGRDRSVEASAGRIAGAWLLLTTAILGGREPLGTLGAMWVGGCAAHAFARGRRNPELTYALLGLFVYLTPLLSTRAFVIHDTLFSYQVFHGTYSDFVARRELAGWLPYGAFGVPGMHFQLACLTPAGYLLAALGALTRVDSAYLLFELSIVLGHVFLLLGTHALATELYQDKRSVFFACLTVTITTNWHGQIGWGLYLGMMYPLAAFLLVRWIRRGEVTYLWLFGGISLLASLGMGYAIIIVAFTHGVMGMTLLALYPRQIARLAGGLLRSLPALIAMVVLVGGWALAQHWAVGGAEFTGPGRDPRTGRVALETFLTYAGPSSPLMLLRALTIGWPPAMPLGWVRPSMELPLWGDQTSYCGLLTVAMVVFAVFRRPRRETICVMVPGAALILLSFGGTFARLVYYVPGMSFYRHIAHVHGLVKILLILTAGFSLDALWDRSDVVLRALARIAGSVRQVTRLRGYAAIMTGLLVVSAAAILDNEGVGAFPWWLGLSVRLSCYALGAAVIARIWLLAPGRSAAVLLGSALLVCHAVDVGLFAGLSALAAPKLPPWLTPDLATTSVTSLPYRPYRTDGPPDPRSTRVTEVLWSRPPTTGGMLYADYARFMQFDPYLAPSYPTYRRDFVSLGVVRLLHALASAGETSLDTILRHSRTRQLLGASAPKLRLVGPARWADNPREAERWVSALPEGEGLAEPFVVLEGERHPPPPPIRNGSFAPADTVDMTSFHSNHLVVRVSVASSQGAWLVYADAYHPSWHATLNGRSVPVVRAQLGLKAVQVPGGVSEVTMSFAPPAWSILCAWVVVLGAIAGALIMTGWFARRLIARSPHYDAASA